MADKDLYLLTDIDPKTVGLVERGAVDVFDDGQNFFLFKSQMKEEKSMADEKTFWQMLKDLAKANDVEVPAELEAAMEQPETPTEPEPTPEPEPAPVVEKAQPSVTPEPSQEYEVVKAQLATATAQMEAMNARIQKAEQDLQKERELRAVEELQKAQGIFIAKAQQWDNMVDDPVMMGKALHASQAAIPEELYKYMESRIDRGERLIKASNVWDEFGSTRIEDDGTPLAKAQKQATEKGIPLAEAILALPEADQLVILAESRGGK